MSITDELREFMDGADGYELWCPRHKKELTAIADRIDAEHEAMLVDARKTVYQGYIELPKDADGEPIHVGDVMEWCDSGDTLEVIGIGDDTLFYIDPEGDRTYAEWTSARNKRHHHAPTVEDVLREFTHAILNQKACYREQNIAEYAAKLRLAEGEDA